MTVAGLLLIATLIMKLWPETHAAQWLERTLVAQPLAFLASVTRYHIILAVVTFVMLIGFAEMGAPHLVTLVAIDVSAALDAMITVWTVAALTRVKGSWAVLRAAVPSLRLGQARPRRRRQRRAETSRRAANDEDGPGAFALAA